MQGVRILTIDENSEGQRLDNFLMKTLGKVPKSHVYRILRTGQVRVNKGRKKPDYKLQSGDCVRIPPVQQAEKKSVSVPDKIIARVRDEIFYEDDTMLAVNKSAGMAVHAGSGLHFGIIDVLQQALSQPSLELVHRLDRGTSGCLLVAKTRKTLLALQDQFRNKQVEKQYLALTAGRWTNTLVSCRLALRKNMLRGGERMVEVHADGKAAVSHFTVLQQFTDCALVNVRIETGRTHQIRVHAAQLGHPIVGDDKYGQRELNASCRKRGMKRMYLHAERLCLQGEPEQTLVAKPDAAWMADMAKLAD